MRNKAKVDFEGGDRWNHAIDLAVAKHFSNIPTFLTANLEKIRMKAVLV